jgi:hypothetical protein
VFIPAHNEHFLTVFFALILVAGIIAQLRPQIPTKPKKKVHYARHKESCGHGMSDPMIKTYSELHWNMGVSYCGSKLTCASDKDTRNDAKCQ